MEEKVEKKLEYNYEEFREKVNEDLQHKEKKLIISTLKLKKDPKVAPPFHPDFLGRPALPGASPALATSSVHHEEETPDHQVLVLWQRSQPREHLHKGVPQGLA